MADAACRSTSCARPLGTHDDVVPGQTTYTCRTIGTSRTIAIDRAAPNRSGGLCPAGGSSARSINAAPGCHGNGVDLTGEETRQKELMVYDDYRVKRVRQVTTPTTSSNKTAPLNGQIGAVSFCGVDAAEALSASTETAVGLLISAVDGTQASTVELR